VLDGAVNIVMADNFSARWMNWLHASFGAGSALAPWLATLAGDWRGAYGITAASSVLVFGIVWWARHEWQQAVTVPNAVADHHLRRTLRLPGLWIMASMFVLVAGLELSAGQWMYTLMTEARFVAAEKSAAMVSAYWASFTAGRLFFGWIGSRWPVESMARGCIAAVICGSILFTRPGSEWIALVLFGFALGPLYAWMVILAQRSFPASETGDVIGICVGASSAGLAILPGLGAFVAKQNPNLIPLYLFAETAALLLLYCRAAIHSANPQRHRQTAAGRVKARRSDVDSVDADQAGL